MAHVELRLPHAFAHGDGLAIKYASQPVANKVQASACIELLCYLAVSAPGRVRFHESNWRNGLRTIGEFQTKAVEYGRVIGFTPRSLAWQIPEIHAGHPLEAMTLLGDAEHIGPPPRIHGWVVSARPASQPLAASLTMAQSWRCFAH